MKTSDASEKSVGMSGASTEPGSTDARVEKLAQRWQDMQETGQNVSVELVCADFPELTPAVREWISKFGKMEAFLATQAPSADTLKASWGPENVLSAPLGPDELGRLGGYRVLKLIGQGGMGKVYLAEDVQLKRLVALKVLLKGGDQRFLREAQTLASIDHDHIVSVYQVGEDRGTQYLSMKYLQGETLEKRLKEQLRLPLAESVRIAKQITQGLAAAHQRGVIHRDIKPSNIWLEAETQRVKILDFGLARSTDAETMLTQEGAVVGTPAFMAPEQAQGNPVDHRADLFSLGCVLYQMISGVSPFARKDVLSTLRALELETPQLPTVRYPDTPGPLSDLAMKLLEKKPENRPASAQSVLETLLAIEKDMATGTSAATGASHDSTLLESPRRPAGASRRSFPFVPVAGIAACLAAVAVYFLWPPAQSGSSDDDRTKNNQANVVAAAKDKGGDKPSQSIVAKVVELPKNDPLPNINRKDFKMSVEMPGIMEDENGVRRVVEGEGFRFKVKVEEDAYVGLWFYADNGSIRQFFPNEFDTNNFFKKGKEYSIPSNDKYTIDATPSKKLEMFRAIASTTPWKWDASNAVEGFRTFRDASEFGEVLRGAVLKANASNPDRITQDAIQVWVSAK
jgi:serine/threonine protein kinase